MNTLQVRNAAKEDVPKLVAIDEDAFSDLGGLEFDESYFKAWLEVYPAGFFVATLGGEVVGYAVVEIINHGSDNHIPNFNEATDNGFIRATHNPSGDTVYGVSVCVSKHAAGFKIGKRLMVALIDHFKSITSIRQGMIVSRASGYHLVAERMTIEEYVFAKRQNGTPMDPLINFYAGCGFQIVKVVPDYMQDPPSHNNGVLMVYPNPNYHG